MGDPNKAVSIDHHSVPPTDKSRCLLCLDLITGSFIVIKVGQTWELKADDECWDQLTDMVEQVRAARTSREGVIMH